MTIDDPLITCNDHNDAESSESIGFFSLQDKAEFWPTDLLLYHDCLEQLVFRISRKPKSLTTHIQRIYYCFQGIAIVVNDKDADIDIFDADGMNAGRLLNERLAKKTHKPIIVLSLQDHKLDSVLYIKKPVKSDDMLATMDKASALLQGKTKPTVKRPFP